MAFVAAVDFRRPKPTFGWRGVVLGMIALVIALGTLGPIDIYWLSRHKVRWQAVPVEAKGGSVVLPNFKVILKGRCLNGELKATLRITFLGSPVPDRPEQKKTFECPPRVNAGQLKDEIRQWVGRVMKTWRVKFLTGNSLKFAEEFLKRLNRP